MNTNLYLLLGALGTFVTAVGGLLAVMLTYRKNMAQMKLTENGLLQKALANQIDRSTLEIERGNQIMLGLHAKIDKLTIDLDAWKTKYYELQEVHNKEIFDLRTELQNKFMIYSA